VNDLAQVDDPREPVWIRDAHKKRGAARVLMLREVVTVGLGRRRRLHPRMMQGTASLDRSEKLRLVCLASGSNVDAGGSHR
jgi:hypothetical protein